MKPSRKFLSLPIISLREGQQIGYVKSLILNAQEKAIAALVIDPKGFFKDQRLIPYGKVVSVGEDAITIDKESQVEKSASLPEILELWKEKLGIIGTKVVTQSGKILGIAEEYFVDPDNGKVTQIEISGDKLGGLIKGRAYLQAEQLVTIGPDAIVAEKGSEHLLAVADKGLNDTLKSLVHSTSHLASEKTHTLSKYFRKRNSPEKDSPAFISTDEATIEAAVTSVATEPPSREQTLDTPVTGLSSFTEILPNPETEAGKPIGKEPQG